MLIDAHHHLWDEDDLPFEWMTGRHASLARWSGPGRYEAAAEQAEVTGSILVPSAAPAEHFSLSCFSLIDARSV